MYIYDKLEVIHYCLILEEPSSWTLDNAFQSYEP